MSSTRFNPTSLRSFNRRKRLAHLDQQSLYLDNLPDFSDNDSQSDHLLPPSVCSSSLDLSDSSEPKDLSEDENDNFSSVNINKKTYCEFVISAILSKVGLTLSATEMVINLFNNVNLRFSKDPVTFPSVRYLWNKRSKKNTVGVYIICDKKHSHGPFYGEPKNYGSYICENLVVKAEMKNEKYFLHIEIRSQLEKHLASIPDSQWTKSEQFFDDYIDDILNAEVRKKFKDIHPSVSSCVNKFTFTMHSDEVQAGNSSSTKIFPIFLSINELKPEFRRKHFFLCGLFVGKDRPHLESYLGPICAELKELEQEPISWMSQSNVLQRSTFHLISLVADAPMRAYLRGVRQYNHTYGCDWCLICATTNTQRARHFSVKNFPEICELKRQHEDFLNFEQRNQVDNIPADCEQNHRFHGIIGGSPLLELASFNIVDGVIVEHMHCLVLGILRSLILRGWFGATITNIFERGIDKTSFKRLITARMKAISVPSEFTRTPRDLDQIKYWKSSEYDSFLVYYLPTIIKGLLKQNVIYNLLCFIRIFHIAHCGPIRRESLEELRNLIFEFQNGVQKIYGNNFMTYNLHILCHLPDSVQNHGPNKNISSYALEDYMGILKEKVRRSSNIAPSLVRTFINDFKYTEILDTIVKWPLQEKEKKDFGLNPNSLDQISHKVIPFKDNVDRWEKQKVGEQLSHLFENRLNPSELDLFKTVSIGGKRFSTLRYSKSKIRCDSIIKSENNNFLIIQFITRIGTDFYALCDQIHASPLKFNYRGFTGTFQLHLPHIYETNPSRKRSKDLLSIKLSHKTKKCLLVKSTELSHKYAKDHVIEPFLFNF